METVEEVFEKVRAARDWNKEQLADYIGVHPSVLSSKLGAHWNLHFRIFMKLLPDLVEVGVIDCKSVCGHGGTSDKTGGPKGIGNGAKALKKGKIVAALLASTLIYYVNLCRHSLNSLLVLNTYQNGLGLAPCN